MSSKNKKHLSQDKVSSQIRISSKTKTVIASIAGLLVLTVGGAIAFTSGGTESMNGNSSNSTSFSSGLLSKFSSSTTITSQNASSNWTGGSDNPYRAKLSSLYVGRLDTLTTAILRKGTSMSDTQFKTYLTNLSTGISGLGSRSQYANDTEVQNILGFLVYEVNATVSALSSNSNAASVMSEVVGLINTAGTGEAGQILTRNDVKTFIQANINDIDSVLSAMIVAKVDPSLIASIAQELGYRDITEQVVVDHTNANLPNYLADATGKLAAKGIRPTATMVDAYKALYGRNGKVVATSVERQSSTVMQSSVSRIALSDVVQKCRKTRFTNAHNPNDGKNAITYLGQKFTYIDLVSREQCEASTGGEIAGNVVYTVQNFSIQPTKGTDGYWINATQAQWASIYALISDLIKNPPATLDRKIATQSLGTQGDIGHSYADLWLEIPVTSFERGTFERGIRIQIAYNFTKPELTGVRITDTLGYDYSILGKQKSYIPAKSTFSILRPFVRGEGVVYAFGQKPQYDFKTESGKWQNQPFDFRVPNLTVAEIGWTGFAFEAEANNSLLKDGLQILNGKTYRGLYCTNASNCGAAMPENQDTIVLYPNTEPQNIIGGGVYTLGKSGHLYVDSYAPEKNLDLNSSSSLTNGGRTEVKTGIPDVGGILSRPTMIVVDIAPYGTSRNRDTGALIVTKTAAQLTEEIAASIR